MKTVKHQWWNDFTYHFSRSNYITVLWNWFLIFAGKAAEPFLFISVLYAGYKLLPGASLPPANIDAAMFLSQMAALDVGGMGLLKIAQKEKLGHNSLAYRVGLILIILMIANVVLATVERLFSIPSQWAIGIEATLLIARAVMCVVYGYAIHSMRDDINLGVQLNTPIEQPMSEPVTQQSVQLHTVQFEHFAEDWTLDTQHIAHPLDTEPFSHIEYGIASVSPVAVNAIETANTPIYDVKPVTIASPQIAATTATTATKKHPRNQGLHVVGTAPSAEQRVRNAYSEHPNYSDRQLAKLADVSPGTVSKWKGIIQEENTRRLTVNRR